MLCAQRVVDDIEQVVGGRDGAGVSRDWAGESGAALPFSRQKEPSRAQHTGYFAQQSRVVGDLQIFGFIFVNKHCTAVTDTYRHIVGTDVNKVHGVIGPPKWLVDIVYLELHVGKRAPCSDGHCKEIAHP
jgi:hypothetical protein